MRSVSVLFFLALILSSSAYAQIFNLSRTSGSTGNSTLDAEIDQIIQDIENDINEDIPSGDPKRLMEGMANSQAASGKGLGTDYISHFETFMVGAGVGVGADLEENKEYDSDLSGAGAQGGILVGLHMSAFSDSDIFGMDPKRLSVVLNAFKFDIDRKADDDNIKADLTSFGFMGTYRWLDGSGNRWFGWDGVRLHTGYQYSAATLTFDTTINEAVNETASGATLSGTITGRPKAKIETSTHSIPLEISSGINFLYIVSMYGGLGTDFNMGSAKGTADANAEDSNINCTGGACGGGQTVTVRSQANINDKGNVQPFFLRAFAGFQFNLPYFNVFAQANKVFGTEVYSVATGARLAF